MPVMKGGVLCVSLADLPATRRQNQSEHEGFVGCRPQNRSKDRWSSRFPRP